MNLKDLLAPVLPQFPAVREDAEIEVLQEIPTETLYLALKNADAAVAAWFFNNASPQQIQGVVDIDCWNGDVFLPERFETLFRHMIPVHPVKLVQIMKSLDPEVVIRCLLQMARVEDFDVHEPPSAPEDSFLITPDSKYILYFETPDPERREVLMQWMNKMSSADIEFLRRQLEACKWEQPSDLEEFGYQMKKGRLEDMGFVDRHEALSLFARGTAADLKKELLDNPLTLGMKLGTAGRHKDQEGDEEAPELLNEAFLPAAISGPLGSEGFTVESLRALNSPDLRNLLLSEIVRVMNGFFAADDVLHGDLESIGASAFRARRYLDLGLAYLANAKAEEGAKVLETQPVWQITRLGWLITQDLVKAARELQARHKAALFGDTDASILTALHGRHPELSPDLRKDLGIQSSSLVSMEAVLKVGARLAVLGQLAPFFEKDILATANGADALLPGESGYARLLAGLFREACGAAVSLKPLTFEEWDSLAPKFKADSAEQRMITNAALIAAKCPTAGRLHFELRLKEHIRDLQEFLKAGAGKRPDPRFFKSLAFVGATA
ncbi:MAG: hypothetical protein JST16_10510 [Bdellovibrionales bacterium]|nr:hypothetical protein [Bdellovibrionales bacterium]